MATKASRIALAGSNISSTGEVDADLLDNIDSAAFLSLDGNGRLGIGTASADSRLHIKAGDSGYGGGIQIEDTDSSTKSAITHVDGTLYVSSNTTADHIAVESSGNVKVLHSLEVNRGAYGAYQALNLENTNGNNGILSGVSLAMRVSGGLARIDMYNSGNSDTDSSELLFKTGDGGTATERLRIDSSGNVGIGTNDPSIKLHTQIDTATEWTGSANLSNTTNRPIFALLVDNTDTSITNTEVNMLFSAGASGSAQHSIGVKRTATNQGDLIFRRRTGGASSAESMRIDASGNVSIGSSDDNPFSWGGSSNNVSITSAGSNDWAQLSLKGNGTGGTGINLGAGSVRHAGIFSLSGSDLSFATNATNSGTTTTTRMTIKSGGNVGIGRTGPQSKLDVLSSARITSAANTGHSLKLEARSDFANDGDSALIWVSDGGASSNPLFQSAGAHLVIEGRKSTARHIYFKVGDTTAAQHIMHANGNVGIGTTNPGAKLTLGGGSFVAESGSSGNVIRLDNIGNSGTSSHYIELSSNLPGYANGKYNCLKTNMGDMHFAAGGVYTGYISHNSGFVDVSDQSLKEHVVTIDGALSKVEQLQGRYFTWISEDQSDDRQIGFIAQEVEAVIPELVTTSDTGIKGVSYGKTTALLVEAIKEQQTLIEQLQARLTAAGIE